MTGAVLVFLGGGIGAALRYGTNVAALRLLGPGFPWSTFAVNIVGSLAMGLLAGWLERRAPQTGTASLRLFLATGVLGGFTTFSAFSLDALALWDRGASGLAALYVLASVALSLGAVLVGFAAARGLAS